MRQLDGMDYVFFGFESDENPIHIAGTTICDVASCGERRAGGEELRQILRSRLERLPLVRRRLQHVPLALDYPYWVDDDDFDLDHHVRLVELPRPGGWGQLMELTAQLLNQPFDTQHPLWELYVITQIDDVADLSPGSFALLLRMHHVFADAATAMTINGAIFDASASSSAPETGGESVPEGIWLYGAAARNYVNRLAGSALGAVRVMPLVGRYLAETAARAIRERASPLKNLVPPRTRLNPEHLSGKRLVDARRFDLQHARAMRALVDGATINDLLLAVVGGALRRYLEITDELPGNALTAVVPINLRQFDDVQSGSNVVSAMTIPLHQEIAGPVERLAAIVKASSQAKRDTAMQMNRRLVKLVTGLPAPVLSLTLAALNKVGYRKQPAFVSTIVSNARSFLDVQFVAGAEVRYMYGIGLLFPGIGSLHACTVYAGHLNIGLTVSEDVMPETTPYMQCLEDSFAEYESLVADARHESARKKKGKTRKARAGHRERPRDEGDRRP